MAKTFLKDGQGYLNWDVPEQREQILKKELPPAPPFALLQNFLQH